MPIYEFICNSCGHQFEELCKINFKLEEIECPECSKKDVKKKPSLFGQKGTSSGGSSSSCGSCSSSSCGSCGH